MTSVAYIWSAELQRAADRLPANVGRSSLVHGLVRALGLLENAPDDGEKEGAVGEGGNDETSQTTSDRAHAQSGPSDEATKDEDEGEEEEDEVDEDDEGEEPPIRGIRVIPPDLSLGTPAELKRYHDQRYLGKLESRIAQLTQTTSYKHTQGTTLKTLPAPMTRMRRTGGPASAAARPWAWRTCV